MSARGFASDNHAGALPEVLDAVARANTGHAVSYGGDECTARVEELFRREFGPEARTALVFNGTGANVVGLQALCRPFDAVVCASTSHLNVDECGAPERVAGLKLLPVDTPDGKLTPALVEPRLVRFGDEHAVQPRVVSLTQSTEFGTVYTPDEVAVGDPDLLERQALVLQRLQQARDLAARIDHRGLHRLGAPDDGAVLLQRGDGCDDGADRRLGARLGHGL